MLDYAAIFFLIALPAAFLAYGGLAAHLAAMSKVLFIIFAVLGAVNLIGGIHHHLERRARSAHEGNSTQR